MKTALIALDWLSTSIRDYHFGKTGEIMKTKADQAEILQVGFCPNKNTDSNMEKHVTI